MTAEWRNGLTVAALVLLCLAAGAALDINQMQSSRNAPASRLVQPAVVAPSVMTPAGESGRVVPASLVQPPISRAAVMAHVRALSETIGPHPAGSPAGLRAARYIAGRLRACGYEVRLQPLRTRDAGLPTANVIAWNPAWQRLPRLVVGAHYDTTPTSPGADDNSTGVAALLEVARALRLRPAAFDVTFVAFGAEECAQDGSHYYVSECQRTGTLPQGMVNLDMLAVGEYFQIGSYGTNPWLMRHWAAVAGRMGVRELQAHATFGGKSDYAAFAAAGVPVAACAWDPEDTAKHTPRDSLRNLAQRGLMQAFEAHLALTANCLLAALLTPPTS